jgi:transposase
MITSTARFHVTSKMVKRQMFGRASLPLLRKRVLLTASR